MVDTGKSFSKSQKIPPTSVLLLRASSISKRLQEAISVGNFDLKSNCSFTSRFLVVICSSNFSYIAFSEIFEDEVRREIGL